MEKIKVGAVSYLNARPLLYGIEQDAALNTQIDLSVDYPSRLVEQMQNGDLDMALMPVASLLLNDNFKIVSAYGIAAHAHVASVCLFSQVPIEQIEKVYLDYQSRTSVLLAQVLLKEFWMKNVEMLPADENFIDKIEGSRAAVIIGDRALQAIPKFKYVYDLAAAWHQHTGLPFVFAGWIAQKPLPKTFIDQFDAAQASGLQHIKSVIQQMDVDYYDMEVYFKKDIVYQLDDAAREGLQLFLEKVKLHQLLN